MPSAHAPSLAVAAIAAKACLPRPRHIGRTASGAAFRVCRSLSGPVDREASSFASVIGAPRAPYHPADSGAPRPQLTNLVRAGVASPSISVLISAGNAPTGGRSLQRLRRSSRGRSDWRLRNRPLPPTRASALPHDLNRQGQPAARSLRPIRASARAPCRPAELHRSAVTVRVFRSGR
jgi:hypothetical protein